MQSISTGRKRAVLRTLFALVIATVAQTSTAEVKLNENGYPALWRAWGYYTGQHLRLTRIARAYPDLSSSVEGARATLDLAFPAFERNARRSFMAAGATEAQLDQVAASTVERLTSLIATEPIDRASSEAFIATVVGRAMGKDVPEDVLQYLLATAFMDRPERETHRGWTQRFSSAGHPKAKGVEIQLQAPRSFRQQEGNRPNIVAKWTSEGGNGHEVLMLMVHNAVPKAISRKEIEDDLRLGDASEIRKALDENGSLLSVTPFSQEGAAGYIADVRTDQERAGIAFTTRSRMYMLLLPAKAISFMCSINAKRQEADAIEASMKKFSEVCRLAVNSIVLPQQYRN